jgi:PBP1b-binding outer membrane lipoprotein LpoB
MFKKDKKIILLILTLLMFITSCSYFESKVETNQKVERTKETKEIKEIKRFQNS